MKWEHSLDHSMIPFKTRWKFILPVKEDVRKYQGKSPVKKETREIRKLLGRKYFYNKPTAS